MIFGSSNTSIIWFKIAFSITLLIDDTRLMYVTLWVFLILVRFTLHNDTSLRPSLYTFVISFSTFCSILITLFEIPSCTEAYYTFNLFIICSISSVVDSLILSPWLLDSLSLLSLSLYLLFSFMFHLKWFGWIGSLIHLRTSLLRLLTSVILYRGDLASFLNYFLYYFPDALIFYIRITYVILTVFRYESPLATPLLPN